MDKIDLKPIGFSAEDDGPSRKIAFAPSFAPMAGLPGTMDSSVMTTSTAVAKAAATQTTTKRSVGPTITPQQHLPFHHTLGPPFGVVFCPHATASQVATRIIHFLEENYATNGIGPVIETLKDSLSCTLLLNGSLPVQFDVLFWKPFKEEFQHGVIVEIKNGSNSGAAHFAFYGAVRDLLDVAAGKTATPATAGGTCARRRHSAPAGTSLPPLVVLESNHEKEDVEEKAANLIKKVNLLVQNANQVQSCLLGLELLLPLTDKTRMGSALVNEVCRRFLCEMEDSEVLRCKVVDICSNSKDQDLAQNAWTIVANALETVVPVHNVPVSVRDQIVELASKTATEQSPFIEQQARRCMKALNA